MHFLALVALSLWFTTVALGKYTKIVPWQSHELNELPLQDYRITVPLHPLNRGCRLALVHATPHTEVSIDLSLQFSQSRADRADGSKRIVEALRACGSSGGPLVKGMMKISYSSVCRQGF